MAARQATQSNAMLYAMIAFIGLFITATVLAIIFYVKSEEYRTQSDLAKADLEKIVNSSERSSLDKIVGKPESDTSMLGTMQKVVNDLYERIVGQKPGEDIPATVKFNDISMRINLTQGALGDDLNVVTGSEGIALLPTIEELKQKLENARSQVADFGILNDNLQTDLDNATAQLEAAKVKYLADLAQAETLVDDIRNRFDSLRQTMDDSTTEQVEQFKDKLEQAQEQLRLQQLDIKNTTDELAETDTLLQNALVKLEAIKPKPDREVQAYQPDAQIVRVDLQNEIVYLDAGINDHVYRGLTFAIYDRNKPVSEDGEGKAEIEVFQVSDRVSAARFVKYNKNNPVVMGDIVANLIWDRNSTNRFVVVGEFDYNHDGRIDDDGAQRITELIERWRGVVTDDITVDTDFVVLGTQPKVLPRPTEEEIDIDPMAQQRYEISLGAANAYDNMLKKANNLGIPVFNQKRFLYLIGYDTLMNKNPML